VPAADQDGGRGLAGEEEWAGVLQVLGPVAAVEPSAPFGVDRVMPVYINLVNRDVRTFVSPTL